ncbi:Coilin like [Actinidia chinensis var. chinensis]|uniref:Coilin like n=1 Tax=Actinidia chinensis var. chinensis TaxID=1590841 RepID=A0A2R6P3H2_ACTCC|nr:Coilin like [Actinidia chinensis var. chinensis]
MEPVRIRVAFEDRHILSKSQRSEGLKRSWLLLKPPHETISDLSSYLLHTFDLYHSCPNGIVLSMDDFVLPQFESTCILKDKDVIRVQRKGGTSSEIVEVGDGANLIEEEEIVEKQPVLTDVPLLAIEAFEKETGCYQSEHDEDEDNLSEEALHVENLSGGNAASKKRKASKKLQSAKKKKKGHTDPQDTVNDSHMEQETCGLHSGKSIDKKKKVSDIKSKSKAASTPISAEQNNDRSGQLQEHGVGCANIPETPDGTRKVPSRSARRKKAKRQWLRELIKAEKKELVTSNMELNQKQSLPEKDTDKSSIDDQVKNQKSEAVNEIAADDEIVPIVIRPGHIRFEPLGKDHAVQQNKAPMETFQWNGITSKKKGQKWGTEKFASRSGYKDSNKDISEMTTMEKVKPSNGPTMTIDKVKPPNDPIDFDKLAPFTSLPREGDVIAYRLLELSSTWTPELSPFRVGKASRYDPESNRILLTPVPEYPITFEKPDEEQADNSLYGENGALEIDFSSLVDVRIVKHGNSDPPKPVNGRGNQASVCNGGPTSTVAPSNDDNQTPVGANPEKEVNAWDEISQAISAKKEQLIQENGWNKESSGRGPWSYRALRSSALGPTMAILRARNDI